MYTKKIAEKSYFSVARDRGQKGIETWTLSRRSRTTAKDNNKDQARTFDMLVKNGSCAETLS